MYVYLTTNNVNGKKYVGMTNGNNKDYIGSGVLFKQALEKYGRENFTKQVLMECHSEDELREAEEFFIQELNAVADPSFYNLHEGGRGGDTSMFVDKDILSSAVRDSWRNYSETERRDRLDKSQKGGFGTYDRSGERNPRSRRAEVNGKEYPFLKAALKDLPDVPYSTLKRYAKSGKTNMKYGFTARYL
jgi:hypothetical protein